MHSGHTKPRSSAAIAQISWVREGGVIDRQQLCEAGVQRLAEHFGADAVAIYLLEDDGRRLRLAASGFADSVDEELQIGGNASHPALAAFRNRTAAAFGAEDGSAAGLGESGWARPLLAGDQPIGAICASFAGVDGDPPPTPDDSILSLFAVSLMLAREADRARHDALIDHLTGLYNRRWFTYALDHEIHVAQRHHSPLALLMIDVDGLKQVNDSHGHLTGDAMLRRIAERLRATLRATDAAARVGGDEFLVLLPRTDEAGARLAAERLRTTLSASPATVEDHVLPVSVSIGAGVWQPHWTADQLIEAADRAMYAAKGGDARSDG